MGDLYFGYPDGSSYKYDGVLLAASLTLDGKNIPDYLPRFEIPMSVDAEISVEMDLNVPLFEKLCGVDLSHGKDVGSMSLVGTMPYREQVRKHKKRRINKKWAKKYGYVTKFRKVTIEDVTCEQRMDGPDIVGEWKGYLVR